MFVLRVMYQLLNYWYIVDVILRELMHGPKWPFLLAHGPGVVVVNCWDRFCILGRAPHTKETLPDFRELCQVTRHPRVFRRLTGCQWTPGFWGVTAWYQR